jgi:triosephosphate isomerase
MRRPIIAANWKMYKTIPEALAWVERFLPLVADVEGVESVVAPPATALARLREALAGSGVALAAQNVQPGEQRAFTGELNAQMLADVGCDYVIVGHSERRRLAREDDAEVGRKVASVFAAGMRPILCVGETLEERDAERAFAVIERQLDGLEALVPAGRAADLVVAYEPVWAIGTGRTATPEQAQEMHGFIRGLLFKKLGDAASQIRIQYGGSVKPDNIYELMAQQDIDGALVGGASLDPESFARIVRFDRSGDTQ